MSEKQLVKEVMLLKGKIGNERMRINILKNQIDYLIKEVNKLKRQEKK